MYERARDPSLHGENPDPSTAYEREERTIGKANKVPETNAFVINLIKDGKLNKK